MNHMFAIFSVVNKHKGFFFSLCLGCCEEYYSEHRNEDSQGHTEFIFSGYTPSSAIAALYVLFSNF